MSRFSGSKSSLRSDVKGLGKPKVLYPTRLKYLSSFYAAKKIDEPLWSQSHVIRIPRESLFSELSRARPIYAKVSSGRFGVCSKGKYH